jgi:hypothetical protein
LHLSRGCFVRVNRIVASSLLLFSTVFAAAKEKKKVILPADILRAETVLVVIDPDAGIAPDASLANLTARGDVEKALMKWGRFRLTSELSTADLVITVRKGNGKIAQPTIGGVPPNNRPVVFEPTDSGGRIGGSRGTPPTAGDPTGSQYPDPRPQVEIGPAEDIFAIFRGKRDNALNSPAVWRYEARDALRSPDVPAVDAFKKAITKAEKQQTGNP